MSTDKYSQHDSKRGIVRSTTIISLGTLSSRILGFVRDIIIAKLLGTASGADAFFVAFRIPNLFRDLVGEGATNSAFVPVFSEYEAKKDKVELWNFVSVFLILSLMVLSLITILGIVFAPVIVRVMAPGFLTDPQKLETTIFLTRIMFPYLILIGLTAYSMGILYTFRSFVTPAFSPCLLNVAMIGSALVATFLHHDHVLGLAIGVLIGGVLQLSVQIWPLVKKGIHIKRPLTLSHPGAKKVGQLLLPRLFGSAVYQLNIVIDTFCASLSGIVGAGGIAAIYYANRIIQFPMGLVGVALASAILPSMAGFAARDNLEDLKKTLAFSLENIFLVMVPASVAVMLLAFPMTKILFERGEFNSYSTQITSWALLFSAFGLVGFGGSKIMVTTFHSLQDTATPVKVGFVCLITNAVLNFLLMGPLKVGGIALASAIASTVNFLVLFYLMNKKLDGIHENLLHYFFRVSLAAGLMGSGIIFAWNQLGFFPEITRLLVVMALGIFIYLVSCLFLKISQVEAVLRWISRPR